MISLIIEGAHNMMISRINSTYDNINTSQKSDSDNNNLQTKLMAEQRRLKAVDSDTNMNASDKAKEKLKIQQQIDELNRKMKLEEMEKESSDGKVSVQEEAKDKTVASEENKEKKTDTIEVAGKKTNKKDAFLQDVNRAEDVKESKKIKETEEKDIQEKQVEKEEKKKEDEEKNPKEKLGIPPQELHKMLRSDFELQKERVLSQVAEKEESAEDVLRAEIKSDTIQGTDAEAKKEKLAELREKKTIQIETIESDKKEPFSKPKNGMKIVIKEK